jgi:hypothetical protein
MVDELLFLRISRKLAFRFLEQFNCCTFLRNAKTVIVILTRPSAFQFNKKLMRNNGENLGDRRGYFSDKVKRVLLSQLLSVLDPEPEI